MKKITSFIFVFLLILTVLALRNVAQAASTPGEEEILKGFERAIEGTGTGLPQPFKPGLEKFAGRPHGASSTEPGADVITTAIFNVIDFVKYVLGTLAVLYITIGGIKLITAGGEIEEVSKKQKEHIKFIIYGLVLAILSDVLVKEVFFGEYGECLASETNAQACAEQGSIQIRGIYNFIQAFIATVAVLVIVLSGFRLVAAAGEEETISKQKKHIAFALVGLVIVGISEFVVKEIVFPEAGTRGVAPEQGLQLLSNITNFVSSFVGTVSFIFLVYGGYLAVASLGNDEKLGKAKKIIIGAIIGILVAFAAFGIVRSVISVRELGEPSNEQSFLAPPPEHLRTHDKVV